jgi:arabinose-5-phosphate isomerase
MSSSNASAPKPGAGNSHIASALRTLDLESEGIGALIAAMSDGLGAPFAAAVETIRTARGRLSPRPERRRSSCTPPMRATATSA